MLHDLRVGTILELHSSSFTRNPITALYEVTSISGTQGRAKSIPNLPEGKFTGGFIKPEIRFSIPRGKVFGSSLHSLYRPSGSVKTIRENNAKILSKQKEEEKRVEQAHADRMARAYSEVPELNLQATEFDNVYQFYWTFSGMSVLGYLLVTGPNTDALRKDSDYQFTVQVTGIVRTQSGETETFSASQAHGKTRDHAIYQWIAYRL